jgi:hypothetical protein
MPKSNNIVSRGIRLYGISSHNITLLTHKSVQNLDDNLRSDCKFPYKLMTLELYKLLYSISDYCDNFAFGHELLNISANSFLFFGMRLTN